jgi:L-alanine-DL-glutamate epimerase-like enolase superfamily enzyme
MELRTEVLKLPLRDPFRIARGTPDRAATTVIATLRGGSGDGGDEAIGEGFPDAYYGETPETMGVVLAMLLEAVGNVVDVEDDDDGTRALEAAAQRMEERIRGHGAAKCALDIALHDLVARRRGVPLHELLGLSPEIPPTDFTIGIDEPDVVAERARNAARFPALKIKLGGPRDVETLEAVRGVYGGPIRVDANTAWQPDDALRVLPELERLGVELIEQPFPARRLDQLRWLQERSPLPIVADESCVAFEDLDGLVGVVAGVNVKLAKCGGVGPAKRMLLRARELGFRTFLGCMEETSVGIAASAAVASLADWVDLDGNLLLAADPFTGLELGDDCRWRLPARAGLGLERVA